MGIGHKRGAKKRMAGLSKKQISDKMSELAKKRMARYTPAQRQAIGKGLVRARRLKNKKV